MIGVALLRLLASSSHRGAVAAGLSGLLAATLHRHVLANHWVALIAGLMSASTLPLGATLGILVPRMDQGSIALIVAFGAGGLLFAVTVELYGESLRELEYHGYTEGA